MKIQHFESTAPENQVVEQSQNYHSVSLNTMLELTKKNQSSDKKHQHNPDPNDIEKRFVDYQKEKIITLECELRKVEQEAEFYKEQADDHLLMGDKLVQLEHKNKELHEDNSMLAHELRHCQKELKIQESQIKSQF